MVGQCLLSGPLRGDGVKPYQAPELEKGLLSSKNLKFGVSSKNPNIGAKAGNACFKISLPATNGGDSSFTAHLEARKGKKLKVKPVEPTHAYSSYPQFYRFVF